MSEASSAEAVAPAPIFAPRAFTAQIPSVLAVLTLLACFAMFYYFIDLSSKSGAQLVEMKAAALEVSQLTQQMRQLPPEKTAQYAKAQDDLVLAQKVLDNARSVQDAVKEQQSATKDFILYILGVLSSAVTTILGYYFGSSSSSAQKTEVLKAMTQQNAA